MTHNTEDIGLAQTEDTHLALKLVQRKKMCVGISEMVNILFYIAVMLIQTVECTETIYLNDCKNCYPSRRVTPSENVRIMWTGKALRSFRGNYCRINVEIPFTYLFNYDYNYRLCYNLKELHIPCGQKLEFHDTQFFIPTSNRTSDKTYHCGSSVKNEQWCSTMGGATFKLYTGSDDVNPSRYNMTLEVNVTRTEKPRIYDPDPSPEQNDSTTTYVIIAAIVGCFCLVCCGFCISKSSKNEDTMDQTIDTAHIRLQRPYPLPSEGDDIPVPTDSTSTWGPVTQHEGPIHQFVSVTSTTGHLDNANVNSNHQRFLGLDSDISLPTAEEWEPTDQRETNGSNRNISAPPPKYSDLFLQKS